MSTFLMIDGNSMANRAFYGVPHLSNAQGVPTNAVHGFLNMLQSMLERFKPENVFVAFDISKKVFRHEKFADYKGTRTGMPEDLRTQIPLIRQALDLMFIENFGVEGYEADDLLGTMSRIFSAKGEDCIIISGDRDLFQLVGDHVTVGFPKGKGGDMEIVTPEFLWAHYHLTPARVIELKGLMGDKSDNIPGITGVGEKTAQKLLDDYGDIDGLYAHLEDLKGKKLYDKLLAGKDDAYLSRELATINRDVPFSFEDCDYSLDTPFISKLTAFYKEYGLTGQLKRLEAEYGTTTLDDEAALDAPEWDGTGTVFASISEAADSLAQLVPSRYEMLIEEDKEGRITRLAWRDGEENFAVDVSAPEDWQTLVDAMKGLLTSHSTYILTDDAKKLTRALISAGAPTHTIIWDAALNDYLLQPEGNDHVLSRMTETYLGKSLPEEGDEPAFYALEAIGELRTPMKQRLSETGCLSLYREVELPLASVLAKMEIEGVRVDTPYLKALQKELGARIETIEKDIETMAGEPVNPNSPKQLGHILFEVLELPVVKKTKTGYSTSAEVLETLRDSHPIVGRVLDYRQLAKLKSTYVDGLLKLADANECVHTSFNQTVTATGRLSSTAPNLQNIPVRTDEGKRIRRAFIPLHEENLLISADYSQIELRVLAHLSGDDTLMNAFLEDMDIHRHTASEVFHVPMDAVTPEQRRTAKAVNFGIIYGQTDYGLSRELGISRKEAEAYINLYFSRYPLVETFIQDTIAKTREDGYVTTMLGRRRYIKDINSRNRNLRQFAERTAVNSPIQGTAADIIKLAMLRCDQAIRDNDINAKMLLQVHDELIFEVSKEDAMSLGQIVRECMEGAVKLNVPLKVDLKAGFNWQEMEKI
ncbi:MAG: DNA polymerase I [Peptococcaceae bacterium]|nr:DNA polymerase I [Peptococcaceae bacterium]